MLNFLKAILLGQQYEPFTPGTRVNLANGMGVLRTDGYVLHGISRGQTMVEWPRGGVRAENTNELCEIVS